MTDLPGMLGGWWCERSLNFSRGRLLGDVRLGSVMMMGVRIRLWGAGICDIWERETARWEKAALTHQ